MPKLIFSFLMLILTLTANADNAADAVTSLKAYAKFKAGDYEEARVIWQQLADKGNTTDMINLANLLQQAMGVSENQRAAFNYIRQAAELGDPRAQYEVGIEYEKGILVPRDLQQAASWLLKSAHQDDMDGQYAYALLLATAFGKGHEHASNQQLQQALTSLDRAQKNGHPDASQYIRVLQTQHSE